MSGEWIWALIIGFVVSFASAVWVGTDADMQGLELSSRQLWVIIVFLFPILGLLLYFAVGRKQATNLRESTSNQESETKTCKFCTRELAADAVWCDACGRAQE
jgi:hypothetical protein